MFCLSSTYMDAHVFRPNKAYANFTNKEDPAEQFAFMQSVLEAASKCRKQPSPGCSPTVHIVAHIAPGVFERTPNFTWFRDPYNEKFLKLTVDYAEVIGMMLFGHHHTDTFHLVKDANGTAVQFVLMSPAVTPWFSSLDGAGANNPAFRLYDANYDGTFNDITRANNMYFRGGQLCSMEFADYPRYYSCLAQYKSSALHGFYTVIFVLLASSLSNLFL
ncbi:hypothetical protein ANCDUO_13187 [Ancylostoma duodenale]|uniref:Calcineurin-like phosphoesterase domain-containing protein n=1 Tax=Ancylostoma duodenale TaxID=51022 RepID=A0A0C2GHT3_9BILA|nr:hypothetical protein ANCDUO_13187 [Ancylostoma duodenale]